eukprot:3940590-Rhodomonas_salina.3
MADLPQRVKRHVFVLLRELHGNVRCCELERGWWVALFCRNLGIQVLDCAVSRQLANFTPTTTRRRLVAKHHLHRGCTGRWSHEVSRRQKERQKERGKVQNLPHQPGAGIRHVQAERHAPTLLAARNDHCAALVILILAWSAHDSICCAFGKLQRPQSGVRPCTRPLPGLERNAWRSPFEHWAANLEVSGAGSDKRMPEKSRRVRQDNDPIPERSSWEILNVDSACGLNRGLRHGLQPSCHSHPLATRCEITAH